MSRAAGSRGGPRRHPIRPWGLYLAGLLPLSAFQAADAFFQPETASGFGPAGFASQDSLYNSAVTSV